MRSGPLAGTRRTRWGAWRARDGLAALEFALLLPMMISLLLATTDIALATITSRRLNSAVQSVAEVGSALAVHQNSQNTLTALQANLAANTIFGIFPTWKASSAIGTFAVTISGVAFTAVPAGCQNNCTYTAQVTWSSANPYGVQELRACGALAAVPNTQAMSPTTLPQGVFGPTALVVADVDYTYKPVFFGFVMGNIRMRHSGYMPPRIGNGIIFVPAVGATNAIACAANATQ